MKKLTSILITTILLVPCVDAQIHLFLEEQEITLKDTRSSAWVLPVARDLDEALDDLKVYCKDRSAVKMKKGGENIVIAEKVSIPTIVTKRGDLIGYGMITENYYGIALIFQLGYDISVGSEEWPDEMKNFRNYSKEFMSYHYEQSYARRIESIEKEIKSLKKQKKQNEGKIASMNKKIATFNKRIAKETDEVKIEAHKSEIATLESDIQELSDTLPKIQSQLDVFQGNVEKLQNESHTYQTAIGAI